MQTKKLPSNRAFGALFVFVFAALSLWRWLAVGWGLWPMVWAALSVGVLVVTVVRPAFLTPFNRAWMRLAELLHRIVSPVVLGVMYAVLIVPVGLFMRLIGRDALRLKRNPQEASYWVGRDDGAYSPERFKNQF
ncbi:SxtJ family membrane protein [Pelomicrobium methylotrophicum]|uniref:SxtJ n=1 Tax=Pelomicrobium methylotrophicum TaxID=2602750 RepID=A0A5C7EL41_9PROT|nr:SxtJ family membrane protein [Pelomicrobium methylotrophicum]TXF13360.1 hypothetical protein FR698_02155 [Pelomicrobium methylotrophicum]